MLKRESRGDGEAIPAVWKHSPAGWCLPVVLVVAAAAFVIGSCPGDDEERALAFDGPSSELARTEIVAAFESPIAAGRNAVWCSTFQVAWNRLCDDPFGAPILIEGAEEAVGLLNSSRAGEEDLDPESYYAASGWASAELIGRIGSEMAERFPDVELPDFPVNDANFLAYAYLSVVMRFAHPYFELERGLGFTDSAGNRTTVEAFGVNPDDRNAREVRGQIEVLFYGDDEAGDIEFAVDISSDSSPYQIVLARIAPRATLADACDHVEAREAEFPTDIENRGFHANEELMVPLMSWKVVHEFEELKFKPILNEGFLGALIVVAKQMIEFRLDREGVVLRSAAEIYGVTAMPLGEREFIFDGPFLVFVKLRGAGNPIFAMWVDNAELLVGME